MARRGPATTAPTDLPEHPTIQEDTVTTVTAPAEATSATDSTDTQPVVSTDATAPSTDASTPATEPSTDASESKPAEKPAEAPIDLTAFEAAAKEAVEKRDEATGELAVAAVEPVQIEYRKLDGAKAKNAAKAFLNNGVREGMKANSIQLARAYMNLLDAMTPATGHKAESKPVDPTEAFAERVAALNLAYNLAIGDVPEGVEDTWEAKVSELVAAAAPQASAYLAWTLNEAEDKGDAPEASAIAVAAVKLSQGKAAGRKVATGGGGTATPFTGERRDIAKHIAEAFADKESGDFLTIAEIRNHKSAEYGDNPPSAGAISARLFPSSGKCTIEGVTPGTNDKGNKGATKD